MTVEFDGPTTVAIAALVVAFTSPWVVACVQEKREIRQSRGLAGVLADEIESILVVLPRGQTRATDGTAGDRIWTSHIKKIVAERTVYSTNTSTLHRLSPEAQFATIRFHTGMAQMPGKSEETRIDLQAAVIRDGLIAINELRKFSNPKAHQPHIIDPQKFYEQHQLKHFGKFLPPKSEKHFKDQGE